LLFYAHHENKRVKEPSPTKEDLVLPTGSFFVKENGLLCELSPPLAGLSGNYCWSSSPFPIAALRLLIVAPDTDSFWVVMKNLNLRVEETDQLADGFGCVDRFDEGDIDDSAYIARDIRQILSWTPNLATHCPISSVAHDLGRIRTMPPCDLGNFVGAHIGLA